MSYEQKYLKYKNKYLELQKLQKQTGGIINFDSISWRMAADEQREQLKRDAYFAKQEASIEARKEREEYEFEKNLESLEELPEDERMSNIWDEEDED